MQVLTDPVPDKAVQIINQSGLLQRGDKLGGTQPALRGVVPAAQGFQAGNLSRIVIHLGLVTDLNLPGLKRRR